EVSFKSSPDFEAPTDANTDNDYVLEVIASDGINTVSQTVTISVTNVGEALLKVTGDLTVPVTALGITSTFNIEAINDGDATLNISSITYPDGFSGISNTSIEAGVTQIITVTFSPTEAKEYSGEIEILSDGGDVLLSVSARGEVITSLENDELENTDITIYPNPVKKLLYIDLSLVTAPKLDVVLLNPIGLSIYNKKSFSDKTLVINVSNYSSGIYILKFTDGKKSILKKVLIRK
ncbi:T9SS type A sorting domain-containing protein, partial [Roseivirga sp.]|uniref:T9SS type A sorting domain-containing protein n=1 Tax=Roseivirga sp. TaxID=1964215 RepID=UPI003B8E928F